MEALEDAYKKRYGLEKLEALNSLAQYYRKVNPRKSIKYGKLAVQLGEQIFSESDIAIPSEQDHPLAEAYLHLGKVMLDKERYYEAQLGFASSMELGKVLENNKTIAKARLMLDSLYAVVDSTEIKQGLFSKALGNLKIGKVFNATVNDLGVQKEIKLAVSHENRGNFLKAVGHYEKAIDLLKNQGASGRINDLHLKIAQLYDSLDQHSKAQKYLGDIIAKKEEKAPQVAATENALFEADHQDENRNGSQLRERQEELKFLADRFAAEADYASSIAYYKRYQELTVKIKEDSLNGIVAERERQSEIALLKQQKRIADIGARSAELEKAREVGIRNASIVGALVLLLGAIGLFYMYSSKKKQHKKLTITYSDLNRTQSKLVDAEKRIVKLLTQQVSADVAQELLSDAPDEPGKHFVCIMFLDIRDFTPMAEKMSPGELIAYQNSVFGFMINAVQNHNGNINQLLGDGFMATFGAPISHGNDCQNAFNAAQEILRELKQRNEAGLIHKTKIGIGLHAGQVVTGNVGNESRKQYSVTGNAVIVASRVEQLNKEHKSQLIITEAVHDQLTEQPSHHGAFMEIKLKGKSKPINVLKVV